MTPRGTQMFARWCVTLCILTNFLLIPTQSFALTAEEPSNPENPTLKLKPYRGPPGTTFTVQGRGFGECGKVTLSWDKTENETETIDDLKVDDDGSFNKNLTVPRKTKPRTLTVEVTSSCQTVSKEFTVVAPQTTTPSPPPATPPKPTAPPRTIAPIPSPSVTPPPYSPPPPTTPPPDNFTKNDNIAEREIKPGSILYNPPEQMRVGEVERIEVRITRQLSAQIYEDLKGRGRPRVDESPITADMKVELIGNPDVFDIRPMSSPVQSVFGSYREWYWDVTPLTSGIHPLSIRATFIYQGQTLMDLPAFERRIKVAVNPVYSTSRWLGGNWDKLLAALGITVAGVFAALYQRLRRRLNEQ